MAGFIDVLLRGLSLCGQAAAIGGVLFALLVLKPALRQRPDLSPLLGRLLILVAAGAVTVTAGQLLTLTVQQVVLANGHAWPDPQSNAVVRPRSFRQHCESPAQLSRFPERRQSPR